MTDIKNVLIDISGVLYVDDQALPGSIAALHRLQDSGLSHCFLTNTTRQTRKQLQARLQALGFSIGHRQLLTAASATHSYILKQGLRPYLLVHPDLREEFDDLDQQTPNAVVVGDAATAFTYQSLNEGFRVLMQDETVPLISMGSNRYFRESDGLSLDMGPFVAALEYACGRKASVMGKPAGSFFQAGLDLLNATSNKSVMIGDDLENDIGGAQAAGIAGILVRTGKYHPQDEHNDRCKPHWVMDDFAAAIDWILENV